MIGIKLAHYEIATHRNWGGGCLSRGARLLAQQVRRKTVGAAYDRDPQL